MTCIDSVPPNGSLMDVGPIVSQLDLANPSIPQTIVSIGQGQPDHPHQDEMDEGEVARLALLQLMGAPSQLSEDHATYLQVNALAKTIHDTQRYLPTLANSIKDTLLDPLGPHYPSLTEKSWSIPLYSTLLDGASGNDEAAAFALMPEWNVNEDDVAWNEREEPKLTIYARSLYKHSNILDNEVSNSAHLPQKQLDILLHSPLSLASRWLLPWRTY